MDDFLGVIPTTLQLTDAPFKNAAVFTSEPVTDACEESQSPAAPQLLACRARRKRTGRAHAVTHIVLMHPLCQEPEKGPVSAAGVHANVVGAVAGSGAVDESSDSEAEQEGPQKLIRKVSTSGQIRSKVGHKQTHAWVGLERGFYIMSV